jgi:hypothetical protein
MEVAAQLLTTLATTFSTTAAPAAAAAAPAATTAVSAGSTLMSILQGTATALSVVGGLRSAQMQADARAAQAEDAKLEASMEGTRGIERRTAIRQRMVEDLGARDVAYAASGVDLAFGTPSTARNQAVSDANSALSTDAETENIRRNRLLSRAAQYTMMADEARSSGTLKAVTGGISMLADVTRRR